MSVTNPTAPDGAAIDLIRARLGGRYALERELGRGGMGTVYLARDIRLDRAVALKVLPPEFAVQSALRERFLLETRTAAGFSHPNIVPVYAVEEADDLLAYAMGLVEGETLSDRVHRAGPLPVRELVRLLQDTAYALAYAHGRGVVHRDIKPDNIMIERATGRALVMDFGISRSIRPTVSGPALTRVGEVVGTPEYMSPEQASGDHVDGRSDLYALGLTAHFAATGRVAVTGDSTQKVLVKQLTEPIPSISESRPDLPSALCDAIDRCVEKDPASRFATAEALIEAIDAGQLAEPEIPLPVRLFAGEVSTLSLLAIGIALLSWSLIDSSLANDRSLLDAVLPVVGLLAILVTRAMTTLGEARQLAAAGFTTNDVMAGLERVVAERARRRKELRDDPVVRRRRTSTVQRGLLALVAGTVLIVIAWNMRVEVAPGRYMSSAPTIALVFSGIALVGMSLVLLLKSPFRMPLGEGLFRVAWLGPAGRVFMRGAGLGVQREIRRAAPPSRSSPPMNGRRTESSLTTVRQALSPEHRLEVLEARVDDLERWRESR